MEFIELRRLTDSIGVHAAARRFGVDPRTVRRWLKGETRPRADLATLTRLEARLSLGLLDVHGRGWKGWRLCPDGLLYAPDLAQGFTQGDVRALPVLGQLVRTLQQDRDRWQGLALTLQDQPRTVCVPGFVSLDGTR